MFQNCFIITETVLSLLLFTLLALSVNKELYVFFTKDHTKKMLLVLFVRFFFCCYRISSATSRSKTGIPTSNRTISDRADGCREARRRGLGEEAETRVSRIPTCSKAKRLRSRRSSSIRSMTSNRRIRNLKIWRISYQRCVSRTYFAVLTQLKIV